MLFILVILVIAFAGAAALVFAVHRQNRALPDAQIDAQLPPEPAMLFGEESSDEARPLGATNNRPAIVERAAQGDLATLGETRTNARLYNDVLNAVIDAFERQGNITALVRHIAASDDLRGNVRLAERVIAAWQSAPDRRSTVDMLHIAALADNAGTYREAVDLAVAMFKKGRLGSFSTSDFFDLLESQFWVLATEARCGGDGFALKKRLAEVRRELAAAVSAK